VIDLRHTDPADVDLVALEQVDDEEVEGVA
jgi:hypothetical protein